VSEGLKISTLMVLNGVVSRLSTCVETPQVHLSHSPLLADAAHSNATRRSHLFMVVGGAGESRISAGARLRRRRTHLCTNLVQARKLRQRDVNILTASFLHPDLTMLKYQIRLGQRFLFHTL
jgi:hypothetical protein